MRRLVLLGVVVGLIAAALTPAPAGAKVPGPNGRIAFARFEPSLGTVTYTMNPDGSGLQQLFARGSEGPRWSPDGSEISIFCCDDGMAAHIVSSDTGAFRELAPPDDQLEVHCGQWSPDGLRLACESASSSCARTRTVRSGSS